MIIDIHVHKNRLDDSITLDLIHWNEKSAYPLTWTESREIDEKQFQELSNLVNVL